MIAAVRRHAMSKLHWSGYKQGEKQRLATAIAEYAIREEEEEVGSKGVYGYAGHAMKGMGNIRFVSMYRSEKKAIAAILKAAAEIREKRSIVPTEVPAEVSKDIYSRSNNSSIFFSLPRRVPRRPKGLATRRSAE